MTTQYLDGKMEKSMKGLLEMGTWKGKVSFALRMAERDITKDFFHAT